MASFLREGLADRLALFLAPRVFGDREARSWVEGLRVGVVKHSHHRLPAVSPEAAAYRLIAHNVRDQLSGQAAAKPPPRIVIEA